jgi:hypothetical protein
MLSVAAKRIIQNGGVFHLAPDATPVLRTWTQPSSCLRAGQHV